MSRKPRDLFGFELKTRRPAFEAVLERQDQRTRVERAGRVRWLKQKLPPGLMAMPSETLFVFQEARATFVDGHFVATVVLAAAFAEHWMAGQLEARGFIKEAAGGLASCIRCARQKHIWPDFLLDRLDYLRKIRNPFVHLKEFSHEHSLSQRSWRKKLAVSEMAEADAKHALETVFALVQSRPS